MRDWKLLQKAMLKAIAFLTILAASSFCCATAQAAVTITRTSAPFFTDDQNTSPQMKGMYVSFNISTSSPIADAWVKIDGFVGSLALGDNALNAYHFGPMTAGATKTAFFYIKTTATNDISSTSGASQGHDISVWEGNPVRGTQLGRSSYSFTDTSVSGATYAAVYDTIEAQASKVTTVVSGPTPATLGGIVTMTISGDTGTTSGPFVFTPATEITWPAGSYILASSNISLPDGTVLNNTLYQGAYTGAGGAYVCIYKFVAANTYSTPTITSPAQYINSGNVMKHAPTGSATLDGFISVVPASGGNSVIASTSCTPSVLPAGAAANTSCTVTFINSGTTDVTLDDLDEVLPASVGYLSGSSSYNGAAIGNPVQSGSTLTWSGQYPIPAGTSRSLVFTAVVPNVSTTYQFAAYGHIGSAQIDATTLIGDNVPATCNVVMTNMATLSKAFSPAVIGPTVGASVQESTLTFTVNNPSGNPALSGLQFTDTLATGLTWSGTATAAQCGGTLTYGAASNVISFTGGSLAAGPASCTITARVKSSTVGTYDNIGANISNTPAWLYASGVNARLQVAAAILRKDFLASAITVNGSTTLRYTISNAATNPVQNGMAFTDTFPTNLKWSGAATSPQCGGTLSYGGAQNNSVAFSGGTLAAGVSSCTIDVTVTSANSGTYTNTDTNMSGFSASLSNGVTAQTLLVNSLPTLNESFTPAAVGVGESATLNFTIVSTGQVSNADFIDVLPLNLKLASATISNTSGNSNCDAVIYKPFTTTPSTVGDGSLEFSAPKIPANTTCSYTLQVKSSIPGSYTNSSGNILSIANLSNGITDSTLTVVGATLTKVFGTSAMIAGSATTLTFTVTNGSGDRPQTGFGFTDTLPLSLLVTGITGSTCNGTASYTPGGASSATVTLSGGSLPLGVHSCTVTAAVTSTTASSYLNGALQIGAISSGLINGVTDQILNVFLPPTLVLDKTVDKVNAKPGDIVTLTIQLANSGGPADAVVFSDTMSPYSALRLQYNGSDPTPFLFVPGTSGLVAGTAQYSYNNGGSWTSTAPGQGAGDPAGFNSSVTNWRVPMINTMNSGSPNPVCYLYYQVIVR